MTPIQNKECCDECRSCLSSCATQAPSEDFGHLGCTCKSSICINEDCDCHKRTDEVKVSFKQCNPCFDMEHSECVSPKCECPCKPRTQPTDEVSAKNAQSNSTVAENATADFQSYLDEQLKDPELKAEYDKVELPIRYCNCPDCQEMFKKLLLAQKERRYTRKRS